MTTEIATADAPQLEQQGGTLAKTIDALQVTTPETFGEAGALLRDVAAYIKRVGEITEPVVTAAHKAHQAAVLQRTNLLRPAENAKRILGTRMAAYEQEVARQHREAEAARERERVALEAAERERVAAEQRRLQAEADDRQIAAAAAAEAAGDAQLAERIVSERPLVTLPPPRPVFVPPVAAPLAPAVAGVSFRDDWDFEVTNLAAIPREYMMPDEVKIRRVVKAMRGACSIPGIKAIPKRVTAVRGR